MDDERVVEEIITQFVLSTCRLRTQLTTSAIQAAMHCATATSTHPVDDAEAHYIPLTTGSVAEFYIEPMLLHVGDIDVMAHLSTELSIPRGQTPPTQLPAEFHNWVKVYEIVDSHLPWLGYVYLELRYLLIECNDDGNYNALEYDRGIYALRPTNDQRQGRLHSPAILNVQSGLLSCDAVLCVRCLLWPPQAADWPTRHRNYGWPDSATVDRVVNNGCDVVGVAHRQCRHHKWMDMRLLRLSFSRAEIVLLNSWMPVQQIVYHMLRVFMKAERLTDSADNSEAAKLSNYHIKTLMMWASEKKAKAFWTDDLNVVRICVELLQNLAVWLTEGRSCPHYFIRKCNLIDNSHKPEMAASQLSSINRSWLSSWFVNNYIRKCSHLCSDSVSSLFDDVSTTIKLQNAVSAIVNWRLRTTLQHLWDGFETLQLEIVCNLSDHSLSLWSLNWWITELVKTGSSLSAYFTSVAFLHIARKISGDCLSDELMDVLAAIVGQFTGPGRYFNQHSSSMLLIKAAKLMKVVANNSRSTVQLIEIELSMVYLYRALRCKDSDSDSVNCLANVYLAVLYYITGQYQTAIDHCTLVTRSQDHSQCSSHVVQGELLPKIDDDIDTVLGLAVFYQHVRITALNQQPQQVTVFTTEIFAHYLQIKCLSVIKCQQLSDTAQSQSSTCQVQGNVKHISDMHQLCIAGVLLQKFVNYCLLQNCLDKQQFHSRDCRTKLNMSELIELLQQSAVEHLTTFRQLEARDFRSIVTSVTKDFEAVYAYKRGDYHRCLQLSAQNVQTLLNPSRKTQIPVFPEFIQLLDDDIVSLTALTLIVSPKSRNHSDDCCVTQLTLSLYLMTQCQLKLLHSVTSLSQTLNLIKATQKRIRVNRTLDHLTLRLTARIAQIYLHNGANSE